MIISTCEVVFICGVFEAGLYYGPPPTVVKSDLHVILVPIAACFAPPCKTGRSAKTMQNLVLSHTTPLFLPRLQTALSGWLTTLRGTAPGLLDGILFAAPKKKTTPGKKRKRMTHKWARPDESMRECSECGRWKRGHRYCLPNCIGRRAGAAAV